MADLVKTVAVALWREEAVRAAPNVAPGRTAEAFADQSDATRARWIGLARAALRAILEVMSDYGKDQPETLTVEIIGQPDREVIVGKCRKCGGDMVVGIATGQTYTAGAPDFAGSDIVTMSPGGPGVVIPVRKCIACGWSVT